MYLSPVKIYLLKTKAWLKAFRLRTLPLAFSVIIAGTAICFRYFYISTTPPKFYLSYKIGIDTSIFILGLVTTLFLQVLSNLANDYGDYSKGTDNQDRVGPERALQSGAITQKEMFRAIAIFVLLCLVAGTSLLFVAFGTENIQPILIFLAIGVLCIAAAIKYTMGKGAYGYRALGDIAVFIFFGGVGVMGSYFLQTKTIIPEAGMLSIAYGFWCTAVLNLNNMRDVDNDVAHKKYTMAYYLGFKGAKVYQALLVLVPYALTYWVAYQYTSPLYALLVLIPLPLSLVMVLKTMQVTERKTFDKFLKVQALVTFLNSLVLFSCLSLWHV